MTNEQKADEICKRHIFDSNHFDCCIEMAEWKDKELKNYLDELLAKLNACEKDRTREATVVEIIKGHFFKNVDLI